MRLALIAALQYLPARQRAVLILRDVVRWRAAEVAELLGVSTAAVNSMLQRARAQLDQVAPAEDEVREPTDPGQRALLDRYVAAFENADVAALVGLLADDAVMEMPPYLTWFGGRAAIGRFFELVVFRRASAIQLLPTRANGQPAFATYRQGRDGIARPHSIQVLAFSGSRLTRIVSFHDPVLVPTFGLPPTLPVTRMTRKAVR
jgi:RNA polymerase sigma-70 factor (ECF subfamily)